MKNRHISNLDIEYNYLWPRHGPRPRKHRNDGDFPEFQRFGHRLAFTVADLPSSATGTLHSSHSAIGGRRSPPPDRLAIHLERASGTGGRGGWKGVPGGSILTPPGTEGWNWQDSVQDGRARWVAKVELGDGRRGWVEANAAAECRGC